MAQIRMPADLESGFDGLGRRGAGIGLGQDEGKTRRAQVLVAGIQTGNEYGSAGVEGELCGAGLRRESTRWNRFVRFWLGILDQVC